MQKDCRLVRDLGRLHFHGLIWMENAGSEWCGEGDVRGDA